MIIFVSVFYILQFRTSNSLSLNANNVGQYTDDPYKIDLFDIVVTIKSIAENTFINYTEVRLMQILRHHITIIQKDLFKENAKIQYLLLYSNRIETIHPEAFHSLLDLRVLELHGNRLKILAENLFERNHLLHSLHLENNQLISHPPLNLKYLVELTFMDISSNQLDSLNFSFNKNLTTLRLNHNNLTELPPISNDYKQLNVLRLDNNKFNCTFMAQYLKRIFEMRIELYENQTYTDDYDTQKDAKIQQQLKRYCVHSKLYKAQLLRNKIQHVRKTLLKIESNINLFENMEFGYKKNGIN